MSYTIEPHYREYTGDSVGFAVYEHSAYPLSSVLAGQLRRTFCGHFNTLEAAQAKWPKAEILGHSSKQYCGESLEEISGLPSTPPAWFDSADAGESW